MEYIKSRLTVKAVQSSRSFESKGHLPPHFYLNANFQNSSDIFTPIFFAMLKRGGITVLK